jgi:hypothetical protein
MRDPKKAPSSRLSSWIVISMLGMVAIPAALTQHTVRVSSVVDVHVPNPSPFGYTVSLLLFLVPILVIGLWFLPQEGVEFSKKAFWWTVGLLFPVGAALDFFFARFFLLFPNRAATLGVLAPALGGGVPLEEYLFYFLGFLAVLLTYIWLDEYWLRAYTVDSEQRADFRRLLQFHPESLLLAAVLVVSGILFKRSFPGGHPGFPGYFVFLTLTALLPSSVLLPAARSVVNWRAFSLTFFTILLTSLLWEATLGVPYGWWDYQKNHMVGVEITAWAGLPIEAVLVWIVVNYMTVLVYEILKRWKSSRRSARQAFLA